jgi:capsular exopolysaccharide synthesis family protein
MRLNPPAAVSQHLAELNRDYDSAKQRYTLLADKRLNAEMAARVDSNESNEMFKIVDPAYLPQRPVGPNRSRLAAMGGFAGIALGFAVAFLRDFLDPRIHKEEDTLTELKLPTLASIPIVLKEDNAENQLGLTLFSVKKNLEETGAFSFHDADPKLKSVILNPGSPAGERYVLLRRRLSAMHKDGTIRSLLVSSTAPGDGKTFSACCIAALLAQETGKVLLIDADWRKPTTANLLGLQHRRSRNNFGAILRGKADLEQSVIPCADLNLYYLQSGTLPSNPVELLSSPELEIFLQEATAAFDWVIIDSPPILAVPDTPLISRVCDGMLMVVNCGKTSVKLANSALQKVDRDRVVGVLLNRVKASRSSYYYGYKELPRQSSNTSIFKLHEMD